MKWIIIAWDQIRLNKKISIILVVFITMSIFLIGVISFYNNIFSYSQKQCEQVLTGTIDNIGLLYVENGDFYSQKAQDFINEAMDKKVVKFIGSISSLETDRFPELARLQGNEQGNLTWIWADQTVLGLCNLEFYKRAEMTDINKNIYHLYLGYNFKKVKVGTQYVVKQEDGKDDVFVVDGILKKHQNFISGEIASGAAAGTTVAVYNMDNRVLVFGDVYPSSGFWIYESYKKPDNMKSELKKLADKNGIQIQLSSLNSYLKNAQIENEKIRMIFSRMFGVILIGTIIINLSMCALSFIVNKKQYGVLYICGFSEKDLVIIYIMENLLKSFIALIIAGAGIYVMFTRLFVNNYETYQMIQNIFFTHIIKILVEEMLILVLILSILPVILIKKYSPQMIVKEGGL